MLSAEKIGSGNAKTNKQIITILYIDVEHTISYKRTTSLDNTN